MSVAKKPSVRELTAALYLTCLFWLLNDIRTGGAILPGNEDPSPDMDFLCVYKVHDAHLLCWNFSS